MEFNVLGLRVKKMFHVITIYEPLEIVGWIEHNFRIIYGNSLDADLWEKFDRNGC